MGFSTAGAWAIIFLGLLIAIGIAFPVLDAAQEQRSGALEERDQRALEMRNTAIEFNLTAYDGGTDTLTVEVDNVGSTTLDVDATDLVVDGVYRTQSEYDTAVEGDSTRTRWLPGERLTFTLSTTDEPDRVKVVTEYGIAITETTIDGGGA